MSRRSLLPLVPLAWMVAAGALALPGRAGAGDPGSDDPAALEARLRSEDAEERRRAVVELAKQGGAATLERLLGMLADPEGMVADQAQLELGRWSEADGTGRILATLGERRSEVVLRVAELLGRLPFPLEADALAAVLHARDPSVRAMLCFSIERAARGGRIAGEPRRELVGALERLLRDPQPRVRADAFLALQALSSERGAELARTFARESTLELRAAAAIAAGHLPEVEGLALAQALAGDGSTAVRVRAAQSLAGLRTRAAALALVARLEAEGELRVARELLELLRSLSGLRHGADPRPWRAWAEALPEDWRAARDGGASERDRDQGPVTAAFAGLPIRSTRVAFLIDLSGSMWDERADGRTRKQAVDAELLATLESLPPSTWFNLIPFTRDNWPWRRSLVPATERNVRDALRTFRGQRHRGHGDYWGALMLALEDPEIDTVIFFGDGRPSGGRRWHLELMRELLEHENRYRAVIVDAVLVDLSRHIERLWEALTSGTGGTYVEVDL